jgi:Putative phage tail protein
MAFSDYTYNINGILSTDKTVMQNMEALASACNTWIAYDTNEGKWSVVINQAGTSIASFNDSNIVGSITVSGTSLDQLYNSVRVQFPHIDLNDNMDYIYDTIDPTTWYPNEISRTLDLQTDIINDPLQAERIGLIELKQNRLDKIIRFKSDFSKLGLKAGDIIDVTSSVYGFTNKMFRIMSIKDRC